MKLKCLGSSSSGNCYLLEASDGSTLMIEAGIKFPLIKKGLGFRLSHVVGCIASHRHNDHSVSLHHVADSGIRVLALEDVLEAHGLLGHHFCHTIEPMHGYKLADFKVFAFDVAHDVPCVGFLIEHPEMGKLLFATDTMMLEYRFSNINHFMIEANYADDILEYNIEQGYVNSAMRERLLGTHMELQTTKGILAANDLTKTREIVLIHLSGDNSDRARFKDEVEAATGLPTYIARNGFETDLTL